LAAPIQFTAVATITPSNANTDTQVHWDVSDPEIISCTSTGNGTTALIQALKAGSATLTCRVNGPNAVSDSKVINVSPRTP
jgi:hypothetical protein